MADVLGGRVRVGIDLVTVDEVRESLSAHGQRYLNWTYTEVEQRDCGASLRRLAARFAAKEATVKALGLRDEPLSWRSIGVAEDSSGRPSIRLTGEAAGFAQSRGVRRLDLSLTEGRSVALAVVLAELTEDAQLVTPKGAEVPSTRPRPSSACTRKLR